MKLASVPPPSSDDAIETHPRILERRAEVEDALDRRRRRRFMIAAGLIVAALVAFGVVRSPLLDVDEIRVIGAERNSPDAIRSIASIPEGTALVGLDLQQAEAAVEALPDVVTSTVTKTWGGVVTVAIEERPAVAWIAAPAGRMIVAADGVVIDLDTPPPSAPAAPGPPDAAPGSPEAATPVELGPPDPELIEVSGAMFTSPVGTLVPIEVAGAVAVAAQLPPDVASVVERIELRVDGLRLRLVGGSLIELGDDRSLDDKFAAVRAFMAQVDLRCLEQIDVRAPMVPILERRDACG